MINEHVQDLNDMATQYETAEMQIYRHQIVFMRILFHENKLKMLGKGGTIYLAFPLFHDRGEDEAWNLK